MTSCASIWRTVRFGRRQTVTASLLLTLPMAEPPRSKRLKDGPRRDGLHVLTGPESLLTFHLRDALDRTTNGFPEECWFVEENQLLKLGRDYGMAEVHSLDEASAAGNHILEIWNAISTWSEVKRVAQAQAQTPEASDVLSVHIAELMQHTSLPGRCRICRREPQPA